VKCGKEMTCVKNDVPVVHYIDDDEAKGIDAVRIGDIWGCPKCNCQVVINMGTQIDARDISLYQLHQFEKIVEIKRETVGKTNDIKERVFTVRIPFCPENMDTKEIAYMFQDELAVFPIVTEETKMILNPNCSESVLRFYTVDPKQMQKILQSIKDEIVSKYPKEDYAWLHADKKIPLLPKAEMYDSSYKPDAETPRYTNIKKCNVEEKPELWCCAGMGDNDAVITVETESFVLNIGNNDIQPGTEGTSWIDIVMEMGLKVQEAEYSEELTDRGRDCTCGIRYYDGYKNLIKDPDFGKLLQKAGLDLNFGYYLKEEEKNPNFKEAQVLLELFKIWRKEMLPNLKPHNTKLAHAIEFLAVPLTTSIEIEDPFSEYPAPMIDAEELRKKLVEKYAKK
jgi:hypothetical protein